MPKTYLRQEAGRQDVLYGIARHNDCEAQVELHSYAGILKCAGCGRAWFKDTIARFSDQDIADRFHVEVYPSWAADAEVLVYMTDPVTGMRYVKAVALKDAAGLERVQT